MSDQNQQAQPEVVTHVKFVIVVMSDGNFSYGPPSSLIVMNDENKKQVNLLLATQRNEKGEITNASNVAHFLGLQLKNIKKEKKNA